MAEVVRISPAQVRSRVLEGEALLVCAYDDPETFHALHLEGAISVQEFRERLPSIGKGKQIVFYCA